MKKSRLGIRIMHWERKHTYEYAILHYVSIGFTLSIGYYMPSKGAFMSKVLDDDYSSIPFGFKVSG